MNDKVSVLLAVYNGEKYIKKAIESVLNQTYSNLELLIGFNGTKDNSKRIIGEFNDPRIKVFDYGMDKGKSKTLNKLIKEASFDWIAVQDDDDIWLPRKLEAQIKYTELYDVIGTFIVYIDEFDNITGQPSLKYKNNDIKLNTTQGSNQLANSSVLLKKNKLIEVGMWDESLSCLEDFDLWIKLIKNNCNFINVSKPYVFHRIHKQSNFNTISNNEQEDIKNKILKKYKYVN